MTPKKRVLHYYPEAILWHWADGYCVYSKRADGRGLGESGYSTPRGAWQSAWFAVRDERSQGSGGEKHE